jgi:hypothetical protein
MIPATMSGNYFIEQLTKRVEEARTEHESARQATMDAKAKEDGLAADLAAYQKALEAEVRRAQGGVAKAEATAFVEQQEASRSVTEAILLDAGNKTEMAENMIRARLDGMSAPEVYHEFKRLNIPTHRNYVYSILGRLEQRGAIQMRNGRYVAVPRQTEGKLFKAS